jgi:hypothetical protein
MSTRITLGIPTVIAALVVMVSPLADALVQAQTENDDGGANKCLTSTISRYHGK